MRIRNYLQYTANLIEANKHKSQDIDWKVSYNFTK
jgi:hypothetical protein